MADETSNDGTEPTTVLATGTFELLHPGHVHYLSESKKLGDELVVIVARESMIQHKEVPVTSEEQRREMVGALKPVDRAMLGSEDSIFEPLHDLRPDVITLGHDQHYDEDALTDELNERGVPAEVVRIGKRETREDEILSASSIKEKVVDESDL